MLSIGYCGLPMYSTPGYAALTQATESVFFPLPFLEAFDGPAFNERWVYISDPLNAQIVERRARCEINPSFYAEITSRAGLNLASKSVTFEFTFDPNDGDSDNYIVFSDNGNFGSLGFGFNTYGGNLTCMGRTWSNTHVLPYSPVNHRWLRVTDTGTDLFYYAAPDGVTWTEIWTTSHPGALDFSDCYIDFQTNAYEVTMTGGPYYGYLDNLNTYPQPIDAFTGAGFNATLWSSFSSPAPVVASGKAKFTINNTQTEYITADFIFDFTDSYIVLDPEIDETLKTHFYIVIYPSVTLNYIQMEMYKGELFFYSGLGDSSGPITYDPVEHRWWRIHNTGRVATFQTSPDGNDWTTLWTGPEYDTDFDSVGIDVVFNHTDISLSGDKYAYVDTIILPPLA